MLPHEAKEHFNELSNNEQPDSPEETIVRLMNRNIIAFNIETGRIFDYHIDEYGVWDQDGKKLYEASSPYFASLADIKTFIENTYTAEEADRLINGNDRHIPAMTEENGQLMLDITGGIRTWNTDPFANRTYIEVTDCTDDTITFEWHSIDWEPYGYDYESTYRLKKWNVDETGIWRQNSNGFHECACSHLIYPTARYEKFFVLKFGVKV